MKPRNTQNTRNDESCGKSLFRVVRVWWNLTSGQVQNALGDRVPPSCSFAVSTSTRHSTLDTRHSSLKAGMTLIELIITLSIMAAVASIALVTLSDMGATSRYEETERRGLAAQQAVIGWPGEISRFFNDVGRYPAVLSTDNRKVLAELYDSSLTSTSRYEALFLPITFTNALPGETTTELLEAVTNVTMGAGWRGPYLFNRNDTFRDYTDNWGRSWWVTTNEYDVSSPDWTTNALLDALVYGVMSEGEGSDGYLAEDQVYPFYENSVHGILHVSLSSTNSYTNTVVFLYVPRCVPAVEPELCEISVSTNGVRFQLEGWSDVNAPSYVETDAVSVDLKAVTFSNVPVGIRKIWAYAVGSGVTNWARPQTIEIKPGSQQIKLYPEDL
jgi:prepilin-type N-terminal cleavage/methylation domain-containing protein